jgi:EAL domain-containing protein (putative c-di-GMP-specific phosphodiesterase class I)
VHLFFEPEMDRSRRERRAFESDLRAALANEEFELCYQPFINLARQEVVGFEALLRWKHPQRGMIAPADFIPLAEETGLIIPLGAWVLQQACAAAALWPSHMKVAVNLSAVQFRSTTLALNVASVLATTGLAASRLELEITETVMLQDTQATLAALASLQQLGVAISLDDFGTGYSSLSYLRKFPFNKIKVDRSFISCLSEDEGSLAIVRAITALSRSLGMTTTAEGVETSQQLEKLRAEACDEVQGYFFSHPVPEAKVAEVIARLEGVLKAA